MLLSLDSFEKAVSFIKTTAREVDKALYRFYFEGGTKTAVLAALAPYQNEDGGFGHGIEPDFRMAGSSPMATSVALQYCAEIGAPHAASIDHPLDATEEIAVGWVGFNHHRRTALLRIVDDSSLLVGCPLFPVAHNQTHARVLLQIRRVPVHEVPVQAVEGAGPLAGRLRGIKATAAAVVALALDVLA